MTITAKFAAACSCCSVPIRPGDSIEWSRGTPARHAACKPGAAPTAQPATAARKSTYGTIAAQRARWGAQRGMGAGHGRSAAVPGFSSYCTDNASCRCYDCAS